MRTSCSDVIDCPKKSKSVQREGVVKPCAVYAAYLFIRSRYEHATFFNVKRTDRRITMRLYSPLHGCVARSQISAFFSKFASFF